MAEKKEMVSEDGYDICVKCHKKTQYKDDTPVYNRMYYVDTVGQLHKKCYEEVYGID